MRTTGLPIPEAKLQAHSRGPKGILDHLVEVLGFQVRISTDPSVLRTAVGPSAERVRKTEIAFAALAHRLLTEEGFPQSEEDDKEVQKVVGKLGFLVSLRDTKGAKPTISRVNKVIGLALHRGHPRELLDLLQTMRQRTVGVPPLEIPERKNQERLTYYSDASLDDAGTAELGGIFFPPSKETTTEELRKAGQDPQRRPLAFRLVIDKEDAIRRCKSFLVAGGTRADLPQDWEAQLDASLRRAAHIGLFETLAAAAAKLITAAWESKRTPPRARKQPSGKP